MHTYKRGFTFTEILVVVAIIGIIATISAATFQNMSRSATLRAAGSGVYGALTNARTSTLAARDGEVYGVHLSTSTVTRFVGDTYSEGDAANAVYAFEGGVTATSSLITSGGDIIFARLTGEPSAAGTIYICNNDCTSTTTIVVHPSGLVEYE